LPAVTPPPALNSPIVVPIVTVSHSITTPPTVKIPLDFTAFTGVAVENQVSLNLCVYSVLFDIFYFLLLY